MPPMPSMPPQLPASSNPALTLRLLHSIETTGGLTDDEWDELMARKDEFSDDELRALRVTLSAHQWKTVARSQRGSFAPPGTRDAPDARCA